MKKKKLPFGVRCIVYGFFDYYSLITTICKLSKKERPQLIEHQLID